ncbi:lymphocyte-specific protein 1 isoform X2 [Syngnathus typhle]|uniref:lymphocyte-specific protein 1 isoform X2 n=1 Tax=Syngnathus typhle TaxID=161592 RepID=UPI002A6ABD8F|nr:lymphocyte-specific protein 1 isoform X2 [Syngnathus typhle]
MSKALLRRNSSKQSLQNLIRLTAQRSVEDAEEVERERRRRAREQPCHSNGEADYAADNLAVFDGGPKPGGSPAVEEDEGFSDWTQRRQQRSHQRSEPKDSAATSSTSSSSSSTGVRCEAEDDDGESRLETDASQVSSTSKAFLLEDSEAVGAQQEVTSLSSNQSKSRNGQTDAVLEAERRLEKVRLGLQEKESQELEELKRRHARAEQELEELARRKEQRSRLRSQEERRRQDEQRQRLAKEEEERCRMKEEMARRRTDAAQRVKLLSSGDADQVFSPVKTPTHKITERTESLSRSLKKSNSFKKTPAPVLVNNIDDKKEQYAHAVENSQEARGSKAPLVDLPNSLEAVTSKKNLFEGRSSGTPKTTSCQVAVTHLVSQWAKGQADVKSGDVMQKKNMWEVIGDSSGRSTANIKGSAAASKKYTFVVTGHGKYEKISVDLATNGKSDLCDS